eukprot:2534118-Rhodomonas_salina.1
MHVALKPNSSQGGEQIIGPVRYGATQLPSTCPSHASRVQDSGQFSVWAKHGRCGQDAGGSGSFPSRPGVEGLELDFWNRMDGL